MNMMLRAQWYIPTKLKKDRNDILETGVSLQTYMIMKSCASKGIKKLEENGRESSGTSRLGKTKEQEKSLKCLTTPNFPTTLGSFPRGSQ